MEAGKSSECVSTFGCHHHHHHKSSMKHHQNSVVSAVLRSLTNVKELLKCSVCFDFMYAPIYQCRNGHTLCSSCTARVLNKCPSCRQKLSDIRCLALEKMAESLELDCCRYEKFGCPEIIPYCTKLIHEDSCNFRPYNCPWSRPGHQNMKVEEDAGSYQNMEVEDAGGYQNMDVDDDRTNESSNAAETERARRERGRVSRVDFKCP